MRAASPPECVFALDLDEIDALAGRLLFLGRRFSVFAYRRDDHIAYPGLSTKESVLSRPE